jgi:hypothetical protein
MIRWACILPPCMYGEWDHPEFASEPTHKSPRSHRGSDDYQKRGIYEDIETSFNASDHAGTLINCTQSLSLAALAGRCNADHEALSRNPHLDRCNANCMY